MKLGFTGTRNGMSDVQERTLLTIASAKEFIEFHHGDCTGSDKQAHDIVDALRVKEKRKIKVVGHPPKYNKYRAYCKFDLEHKPEEYLVRNHNIVDATDILIATPDTKERIRSGTWATIRYARQQNKKIYIIHKSGRVTVE